MVVTESDSGRISGIHISSGGVPKQPLAAAMVLWNCMEGDGHNDHVGHGGPDRAVCIFSAEVIEALRNEGHPIFPGSTGENVTVSGLDWTEIVPGTLMRMGAVRLQVTRYASPCRTIRESFSDGYFNRISQKLFPGWSRVYARVLTPGRVLLGDSVFLERDRG